MTKKPQRPDGLSFRLQVFRGLLTVIAIKEDHHRSASISLFWNALRFRVSLIWGQHETLSVVAGVALFDFGFKVTVWPPKVIFKR